MKCLYYVVSIEITAKWDTFRLNVYNSAFLTPSTSNLISNSDLRFAAALRYRLIFAQAL
ncbi:hypothetical protein Cylst_2377 [Cylindrospermum stagnale PCC 7417]|uniref:Uncharacterized protein n=1 Tax=Cylindrospermum stagnale PCC 7417 TaxID=56107 RepID=K9WW64_9NOST|nr:hypothetical protein [Cylindrospermum stagnale]AFZ24600.1 hypothetical protein Cylst_2377 [Cylindrospermum stagnale PCC 7417]